MTLIQEKVAQAIELLREYQIPCWLTFVRETQINGDPVLPFLVPAHLTWPSAFIITASGERHAIVGRYDRQMVQETGAYEEVEAFVEGIKTPLLRYLHKLDPASIAINYSIDSEICDGLTHGMFLMLVELVREIRYEDRLVSAERMLSALRQRKTPEELARIREAVRIADKIFTDVGSFIRPGMTERDVAEFMRRAAQQAGVDLAWDATTCPAVFSGPDTAEAHYGPTGRAIERGHVLNMDFGVRVEGYCSDLQRTYYVLGEHEHSAPPEVQRGFDTIVQAIEAAREAIRPGVTGHDVDAVARHVVVSAGYEEFPHALGHQVGRFSHDGTALLGPPWEKYGRKPFLPLETGMVFTIEPRLTVAGRGIVTVEEMVIITCDGADWLSMPQQTLRLVR